MVVLLRRMRLMATQAAPTQKKEDATNQIRPVIPGLTLDT
jgi:hypothetical protein